MIMSSPIMSTNAAAVKVNSLDFLTRDFRLTLLPRLQPLAGGFLVANMPSRFAIELGAPPTDRAGDPGEQESN